MPKRDERLQILLSTDETDLIDDWRYKNRIPSRAAAIRELIGRSISSEAAAVQAPLRSTDIGVLESALVREGKPTFTVADARAKDLPLIFVSDGFCELTEYDREEMLGRNCRFLQGKLTKKSETARLRAGIENAEMVAVEIVNYRKSGKPYSVVVQVEPIFVEGEDRPIVFVGTQRYRGEV